jgi:hypothetical protein
MYQSKSYILRVKCKATELLQENIGQNFEGMHLVEEVFKMAPIIMVHKREK